MNDLGPSLDHFARHVTKAERIKTVLEAARLLCRYGQQEAAEILLLNSDEITCKQRNEL